jgi:hypothetical protein
MASRAGTVTEAQKPNLRPSASICGCSFRGFFACFRGYSVSFLNLCAFASLREIFLQCPPKR